MDHLGQRFGNYRVVRLLGQGGFADVYLAEHVHLGTQAAIKILRTHLADASLDDFLKEARTIATLVHPRIIRILDFGIENTIPYLVMDYAPLGTIRQQHPSGTRLPLATVTSYVRQVAEALQYAHDKRLIHRDVKPENLLLRGTDDLLLSDFGIALVTQSTRFQQTQEMMGTAAYMAPEQLQGKPRRATDQYALGIVIYEWLSGERPFHGSFTELYSQQMFAPPPPLREKIPELSPDIEQVVRTALAKEPDQRFATIQAFAHAFENASQRGKVSLPASPPANNPSAIQPVASNTPNVISLPPPQAEAQTPEPQPVPYNAGVASAFAPTVIGTPPAPPVHSAPAEVHTTAPRKKSPRLPWIIGIALIVLLLIASGAFYAYQQYQAYLPSQTLDTFCQALVAQDYQTAYNQFAQNIQSGISEQTFANDLSANRVISCTHGKADATGSTVTTTMRLVHVSNGVNNDRVTLKEDANGNWKITALTTQ